MNGRTLRSKRLRLLLWQAAGGRCQRCGGALGADWEADHVQPWAVTRRTNVHEMQALCGPCNRVKGVGMLRQFQAEMRDLCRALVAGVQPARRVVAEVTPGGGKSALPVVLAHELLPQVGDRICWVVPRLALQEQAEAAFQAAWLRDYLGHAHEIRRSTNEVNPSRDKCGYVTTYQAIGANPQCHADEFARRRYILVLDEFHHVDAGGPWQRALGPLVERAALVVLMTGTLQRHDQQPIAFLPHRSVQRVRGGRLVPGWEYDLTPSAELAVIRYRRADALRERAVRRLEITHADGAVIWVEPTGQSVFAELGSAGKDTRKALFTALTTEFAYSLLEECVARWQAHRVHRPPAKLLVVAGSIASAKQYRAWLHKHGVGRAAIATSEETQEALEAIRRFKHPHEQASALDALVTVQMAYEGLDVPAITHIACLTYIRSIPWIEQMLSRANRVAPVFGPWAGQFGYMDGPNDALLVEICDAIRHEQEPFMAERIARETAEPVSSEGTGLLDADTIAPQWSNLTESYVAGLGENEQLTAHQTAQIRATMEEFGLVGSVMAAYQFLRAHGADIPGPRGVRASAEAPAVPPSRREARLRQQIERHCRSYDSRNGREPGWMNREAYARFRKPRKDMSESELLALWQWLQRDYPLAESS